MIPEIRTLSEKKLIGKCMSMSFASNKTFELWSSFMPRRKEIKNSIGTDLYSMQVYDPSFDFKNFDAQASFDKWATIEVSDFNAVPDGMESMILPPGLYAVFIHKGLASEGQRTFSYIFSTWLPSSDYVLDNRPHFELLGEKYKNNEPDSEEEIWVPVRMK